MWWAVLAMAMADEPLDLGWRVVNDTVMGGVSASSVAVGPPLRFTGELSLERNGGFVSMRSARVPEGLAEAIALELVIEGDGRTYQLTATRADVPLRAGSYRAPVATTGGRQVVRVPLSAFRPASFGRPVPGAPALDAHPERIDAIGLLLSDGQPGPFRLVVEGLEVVGRAPGRAEGHDEALDALRAAVAEGVPRFNAGDVGACRRIYREVLQAQVGNTAFTQGERAVVAEALREAEGLDDTAAAWALRHALDTLLASAP